MASFAVGATAEKKKKERREARMEARKERRSQPIGVEMGEIEKSRANHLLQSSRNDQYWTQVSLFAQ